MRRRSLPWLVLLVLGLALVTPAATRAETPPVPVVLFHGHGGGSDLTWRTAVDYLEGRGYRLGVSLFALDLDHSREMQPMGLLADATTVAEAVRRISAQTGASQVDLVGHSRGGLVARLLATGDTAGLVRRVVTLNTPHQGALSAEALRDMLHAAGLPPARLPKSIAIPPDLEPGSTAFATMFAREQRFADRTVPVLAIATTWQTNSPAFLSGHDGAVSVASQLGWPGARTALFRQGPTAETMEAMARSDLGAGLLVWNSPHLQSLESPAVLGAVADFLLAPRMEAPRRPCEPNCRDWHELSGHWAADDLKPLLEQGLLPYTVTESGQRVFDPNRPMTRAEFVYGLARSRGWPERLRAPSYPDMAGHWALGWVEAAVEAGVLKPGGNFDPDRPIARWEAASMAGHLRSDQPFMRAAQPLSSLQGALLLLRSRPR